ncbi:undecaprenyl diphosphate synthase [Gordonia bronchialis DSM 43247]|uniref:Isoprenyl transferase n=1 Tax=Gordonia bronchialis (strain ATCC 25592 / DSM 43247 / BCRC 13721 / JCM 3198 / KCTC 3076 / NBRC 16047 / NCTC 10667) TaxID=526226 RepID=D0L7R4_GORB4|nr:isoprenyl transferase [Gordonia bronchialis]ACY20927.1 undecaprenyl diphosphate synthase [Gordonia bronchialis DSM 43247]MCC3323700.1 isoprenyl transferase [Gordonia bronchialis]QGS25346.1 isoprenyl transferase [Gordonia bronchialis]UAK38236.1 isoprenyl transferase [Gordonia bronchialis]STQ63773.1 Short-chain Z-isoprenyl diphosphate synthase [Gordonia bronchialis]
MKLLPDRLRRPVLSIYERRLIQLMDMARIPRHVAIICDGNRRWAREAGFEDVSHGHRVGAQRIADMLGWCADLGIGAVTIYLLSTENLSRESDELDALMEIVPDIVDEISAPDGQWRVRIVGTLDNLPGVVADRLRAASDRTRGRDGMNVNVAVGYGGRQEIVDAVRALLEERLTAGATPAEMIDAVTVEAIDANLYTKGQPDPDLVIRTSGEQRLSGFLLWQSAYSEIWFTDAYWPEFRRVDFLRALRDYSARNRRFGK